MKGSWAVTGANGFVGSALCDFLDSNGEKVVRLVRRAKSDTERSVGNVGPTTHWSSILESCQGVIHLAARVHVMQDTASDPLTEFRRVNTAGSLHLAEQAAKAGVKRFIFLSTAKVLGDSGRFSISNTPTPPDPYSISKLEAEMGLQELGQQRGMEVVILRPPLIHGPGVKANFYNLMRTVDRGWPLPLGAVYNRRSLIFLNNLLDAIKAVMYSPKAPGKTYLLSDAEVISSAELVRSMALALGRKPRLLNIPPKLIKVAALITQKNAIADRLLGDFELDTTPIKEELNWNPPFTLSQGMIETAQWYKSRSPVKSSLG